jgi:hypothetical protein
MRHWNDIRQHASGAGRMLGAGLLALLAALGRQADDVARGSSVLDYNFASGDNKQLIALASQSLP